MGASPLQVLRTRPDWLTVQKFVGSPEAFGGVGPGPEGDVKKDGARPCGLEASEFVVARDGGAEEFTDGEHDGDEAEEIAERDEWRSLFRVGEVFLCGRVAEADLFLVVEPDAVVGAKGDVDDPLHKAALDAGFVV